MAFHPAKCNVGSVNRNKNPIKFNCTLHGNPLESLEEAKYIGLTIRQYLNWKGHVSNVCMKSNKTLGFLGRIIAKHIKSWWQVTVELTQFWRQTERCSTCHDVLNSKRKCGYYQKGQTLGQNKNIVCLPSPDQPIKTLPKVFIPFLFGYLFFFYFSYQFRKPISRSDSPFMWPEVFEIFRSSYLC